MLKRAKQHETHNKKNITQHCPLARDRSCPSPERQSPRLWGRVAGFRTGSGQTGFSQKGHKFHTLCYMLLAVRTRCRIVPYLATFCHMSPHFKIVHIFPSKFIRGNCGTSATNPAGDLAALARESRAGCRFSRPGVISALGNL